MTIGRPNLCVGCTHLMFEATLTPHPRPVSCAAFPTGIPGPVLSGTVDHRNPYPGDHGIHYEEKVEGTAATYDASRAHRRPRKPRNPL